MNKRADEDWVESRSNLSVEGVKARRANFVSERSSPRPVHHEYVFSLAVAGATEIDCGHCGETHVLRPKDLLLTEAHEVYASRALGLMPHEFQNLLRIEKAQNLIARGKPFAEIACSTGFSDRSHCNRFFKRYTGITPKRFLTK